MTAMLRSLPDCYRVLPLAGVLGLWSTLAPAQAQEPPNTIASRIPALFAPFARPNAPGCAVGVFRAGQVVFSAGYGAADAANGIPLSDTTRVWLASASKQFTAFAVLLLEADGKLRLTDDVRLYVPEVPDLGQTITIRDLLRHTSGLREQWNLLYFAGWRSSDVETRSDVLGLLERQRALNHHPGEEFLYNNTGYFLLAIVVERVSGQPFRDFIVSRVFGPLDMTRSDVVEDVGQVVPVLAAGYWGHDPAELRVARPPYSFAGPTGVVSTLRDLALWDANFYSPRVGTWALLDSMTTNGRLADGTTFGYGMGLFIGTHRGHRMISHAGSDPGYRAELLRFPDDSLSVAVLCNAFDIAPTPLALQVADLYLPARDSVAVEVPPVVRHRESLSPSMLAGLYWNSASGETRGFFHEDGRLVLDGGAEGRFPLAPVGENAYRLTAAPRRYIFTFQQESDGLAVREDIEGSPVKTFRRVMDEAHRPAPLQELAGSYYSSELEVSWRFVVTDERLVLLRHRMQPDTLTRIFCEVFQSANGFVLEFTRTRPGVPASVAVSTERVRRLRFTRLPTTQ